MSASRATLPAWLSGTIADYRRDDGIDLLARWHDYHAWSHVRYDAECETCCKSTASAIRPELEAFDRGGRAYRGVNLASQDYLNLASHPAVHRAAIASIEEFGVHSAGSAALMGNTSCANALELELARFLQVSDCTIFPTGWAAAYGVIKTLVRPSDHVVIDMLAHASLQEGARDATPNVHLARHCSVDSVEAKLRRVRERFPQAGILVASETLFSMDSDVPDVRALQEVATRYRATLLIDVAHDLGALGPAGTGILGAQGMLGHVDLVMGSFSKTFASNGGFVATNERALKLALRYNCGPLTFTNAMSPVAAQIVRESLRVVCSTEGDERRARLLRNIRHLREQLQANGFSVLGHASPIVPVILGDIGLSRLATKYAHRLGAIVNLIEFPAVSRNSCRWRLQVMADHTVEQLDRFVSIAVSARAAAQEEWETYQQ